MDFRPPTRPQLAKIAQNDPDLIRALERLFQVSVEQTPNLTDNLDGPVDQSGAIEALRAEIQGLAMQAQASQGSENVITDPRREFRRHCFGQFYDTTTQTAGVINTATVITFDTADIERGVWLDGTQIKVCEPGVYNFQLSIQVDKTSGGTGHFYIWFAKNGTAIPASAGNIRIQGNDAEIFSGYNLFVPMGATDYVEVMFSVDNLDVELKAFPASAPVPAIPSIILTVSNNLEGEK